MPINLQVTQLVRIAGEPISFQIGWRYYAEKPPDGRRNSPSAAKIGSVLNRVPNLMMECQ
jgi:hypothetical protein